MTSIQDAREVLRRHFGYADFRAGQRGAISAVLRGRDVLVLMPTGGGKSLCYQVPSQLLDGPTLVVSPLISLMQDQVDALGRVGIRATFVNSTLERAEMRRRLDRWGSGEARLLYLAPERFESRAFLERLAGVRVALMAVDEAHCISEWGHEFRPSYRRLGAVRERLGCPVVALTATATPEVRRDIAAELRLRSARVIARGFDRPNLRWRVDRLKNPKQKDARLLELLRKRRSRNGSTIIYAPTRKAVDTLADGLHRTGIRAGGYHGGVDGAERRRLQERFMAGDIRIIAATNAFGMGVDKSDVRLVVHYAMAGSLEAYYQEAGRAGRDGDTADCVLLNTRRDRAVHEFLIRQSHAGKERKRTGGGPSAKRAGNAGEREVRKLRSMDRYVRLRRCRLAYLLRYFGERPGFRRCGRCDRCGV